MSIPNKSSRYVWAYQADAETPAIIAVDSLSYEFGGYNDECGKWNTPFIENDSIPSWVYASRTPTLTDLETTFPTFTHVFLPYTIQWLAWMLKNPTNTTPTVTVAALHEKLTYPLTIRNEENEGTVPTLTQAVSCYCIGATAKCERDKSFLVELEFAWQKLESIGATQGNRPILTTAPLTPAELTGEYDGNPYVIWDVGGANTEIPEIWRADFKIAQEHEIVSANEGADQIVYTHKVQPIQIILHAVFASNVVWDKYMGRTIKNMSITIKKYNGTNYQKFTFTNARVKSFKKTGDRNEGHYASICTLQAEKVEGLSDFFTEGGTDFADHFKAAIT